MADVHPTSAPLRVDLEETAQGFVLVEGRIYNSVDFL